MLTMRQMFQWTTRYLQTKKRPRLYLHRTRKAQQPTTNHKPMQAVEEGLGRRRRRARNRADATRLRIKTTKTSGLSDQKKMLDIKSKGGQIYNQGRDHRSKQESVTLELECWAILRYLPRALQPASQVSQSLPMFTRTRGLPVPTSRSYVGCEASLRLGSSIMETRYEPT